MTSLEILSHTFRPINVPTSKLARLPPLVGIYLLVDFDAITYVGSSADVVERLYQHAKEMRTAASGKQFDRALWTPLPLAVHPHYEGAFIRALCPRDNWSCPKHLGHDAEILDGFGILHLQGKQERPTRAKAPPPGTDTIAGRIRAFRIAAGKSMRELADDLGMCRQAVWKWENGDSAPTRTNIVAVARVLSVSVAAIYQEAA